MAPNSVRPETQSDAFADDALTDDAFLDGGVRIWQPKSGFRAATDAVFLAAACPAAAGERVLDVGAGAGTAAFCLAFRQPGVSIEGVDRQPAYVELSQRNARRNRLAWMGHCADIRAAPLSLRATVYDHILSNPPFYPPDASLALDSAAKDAAYRESATLGEWLDFCLKRLKPKGALTLIHRAERAPEILAALAGRAGDVRLFPLWPRRGAAAKRLIIRAVKDSRAPFRLEAGLVLHPQTGEGFTPEADAVLRGGAALEF